MLKKVLVLLIVILLVGGVPVFTAAAAAVPAPDQMNLMDEWEANGYPDDVGGVYFDRETKQMVILLVDATDARKQEILTLALAKSRGDAVAISESKYSLNELLQVQEQISEDMKNLENKIYSLATGWTTINGEATGFGPSGKEFRVVVSVDERVFEAQSKELTSRFGDRVHVEIGTMVNTDSTATNDSLPSDLMAVALMNPTRPPTQRTEWVLPVLVGLALLSALAFWFFRRRGLAALAAANGTTIPSDHRASKAAVVHAIRDDAIEPSEQVRDQIMQTLDL